MNTAILIGLFVMGACVVTLAAMDIRFSAMVRAEMRRLAQERDKDTSPIDIDAATNGLPSPVQRYLRYAIADGAPRVSIAVMRHGGTFRTGPKQGWMKITGEEVLTANPPSFIWSARVSMAGVLWIRARDKFAEERGNMYVRLLSAITVANASGPQIDLSSMMRFYAESAWIPTALLPSEHLRWEAVDEHSAIAHVSVGASSARLLFTIAENGKIVSVTSDDRFMDIKGKQVRAPWGGRYSDWRRVDGYMIPHACEVFWSPPDGEFSYARFTIEQIEFNSDRRVLPI